MRAFGGPRRAAAVVALTAAAGAGALVALEGGPARARAGAAIVDRAAPSFSSALATRPFSLADEHGHTVLLTFLDTQAQARAGNDPSRAQIPFLESMDTQNRRYGLRTVIVDTGGVMSRDVLVNFTYDWSISTSVAVVGDPHGSIARAYRVTTTPTTFLIDGNGVVRRRWNGFAPAAQLDFAIRPLVGRREPGS